MVLYIFYLLAFVLGSCQPVYQKSKVIINDRLVEVHFGRELTDIELDSIKNAVFRKGISLHYLNKKRDGRLLTFLRIEVNNNRGGIARASTNFVNLRAKAFGFRIRLDGENDESSFQVGEIDR